MNHEWHSGPWRRASVADEAAEWLAMCSDPTVSAEDRAAFVAWLRRSNLHVEEFLRLSALTQRLAGAEFWSKESVEELVARALAAPEIARFAESAPPAPRRDDGRSGGSPRRMWALAASAVFLLASALLFFFLGPEVLNRGGTLYSTAVGEWRSITLPDGSVVELNTQSSLRMRFSDRVRLVELMEGEAIFRVAKDRERPFRVVAGESEIVAVGTAFNVYAEQSRTVVTVLEGRVRVSARRPPPQRANGTPPTGAEVELGSGEQAVIAPRRPISRVRLADASRVTSWTERRLIFEDVSLASVAEEFARYSPRVIRLGDAALAERHITGVFDASDPASLVQFLGAQSDIAVEKNADGWTLKTRP